MNNFATKIISDIRKRLNDEAILNGLPLPSDEQVRLEANLVFEKMENTDFGNFSLRKFKGVLGNIFWVVEESFRLSRKIEFIDYSCMTEDNSVLFLQSGNCLRNILGSWKFSDTLVLPNGDYKLLLNDSLAGLQDGGGIQLNLANSGEIYALNTFGDFWHFIGVSGWEVYAVCSTADGSVLLPGQPFGCLHTLSGVWTFSDVLDTGGNLVLRDGLSFNANGKSATQLVIMNGGELYALEGVGVDSVWYHWNTVESDWSSLSELSQLITITPGVEFAADSIVHRLLPDDLPLDPNSALWVSNLEAQIAYFFGVASVNIDQFTPPFYIVGPNVPTQQILGVRAWDPTFVDWGKEPLEQQLAAVPIPDNFSVSVGSDAEAMIYQPSTGKYWEVWVCVKTGAQTINSFGQSVDQWQAAWGGRMDNIATNPGHFIPVEVIVGEWNYGIYNFGTTATGLPFLAYTMSIQEQQAGVINHMLGLSIPQTTQSVFYPPAQRGDGSSPEPTSVPEGIVFRFPANLDLDAIPMEPYALMIAKAVQKHGMVVWDTSGVVGFRAENPGTRYPGAHPYYGPAGVGGGILNCPFYEVNPPPSCYADSNARLAGFPWGSLQALLAGSTP